MTARVLITGGAGFIGARLARRLLAGGEHVTVLDDLSAGSLDALPAGPGLEVLVGDVRDAEAVHRASARVDLIFHLASVVGVDAVTADPGRTGDVIREGTEAVLRAALDRGCPLVFFSSSEVTDGPRRGPREVYARAKRDAESLVLGQAHVPVTVVRPFNVVGAGQSARGGAVLPTLAGAARRGEDLLVHGDGHQTRTFLHVEDLLDATTAFVRGQRAAGSQREVVEVGDTRPVAIGEVAERLARLAGRGARVRRGAGSTAREDRPRRLPDLTALCAHVDFRPRHALDPILRDVLVGA